MDPHSYYVVCWQVSLRLLTQLVMHGGRFPMLLQQLLVVCGCCLLVFGGSAAHVSAQLTAPMSAGVLDAGTPVAIAMACSSGYKLGQVVAAMKTTDGSQFTYSSGASLPLAADGSAVSSQSYATTSAAGAYYVRYTCQSANGYCAVQFSVGFYCILQSGQHL
jgi:hypothetical protein